MIKLKDIINKFREKYYFKLSQILEELDIENHLKERGIDFNKTNVVVNKTNNVAYFFLYNLSGQLVGYQYYNPTGLKAIRSNFKDQDPLNLNLLKYKSYVSNNEIAVYGLETYDLKSKYLFIVEGIFDSIKIHNAGYPAIATLSNDVTKSTRNWIKTLPQEIIVIYDNDEAGKRLIKLGHRAFTSPKPYKDIGEMPQTEVNEFLNKILNKVT